MSITEDFLECFEPGSGAPLGRADVAAPTDIRGAVDKARRAQRAFGAASLDARRRVLEHILDHLLDHADELCEVVVRDAGKTRENAMMGEIWPVADKLRWTIDHGAEHLLPERVRSGLLVHKRATIEYRPRGVIGAIIPWNYPLQNVMNAAIPALLAGNALVVKVSEWVAWSAPRFQRIFDEALEAEGFSKDLVQVINGDGAVGEALVKGGVDGLVFIGSVPNGKRVIAASAEGVVPLCMELGGKDPYIVCDDADLEQAVHGALSGCFINCGQNCVASERLLIFDGIYDAFEQRVGELARALRQGAPLPALYGGEVVDVGAMVTPLQLELVEGLVERAIAEGARVVAGGKRYAGAEGDFFEPTVLADVTPAMEIMREEVFGPVMLLCRVADEHEAIEVANGTPFGLGSSVFSRDRRKARRIADALQAGMTAINDYGGMTYMAQELPFGGVRDSGFGRLNGREGLRWMTNVKAVLDDRLPLHQANKVYPVGPKDYEVARDFIGLLYGRGVRRRLRSAGRLAATLLKKK